MKNIEHWLRAAFLLVVVLIGILPTKAQVETGDVMYVYQKDGNILSFLRDEIKEMSYSKEDTLGVSYDEVVSQLIAVGDSIYRIPLDQIDSISFVTPPTVLKADVKDLAPSLAQYVVDSKELTLYLSGSTPESLLPVVGSRVVLAERSFAGDVVSVTREDGLIVVKAAQVDLEDIFETYYAINVIDFEQDGTATTRGPGNLSASRALRSKSKDFYKTFKLKPFEIALNEELVSIFLPGDDESPVEASAYAQVQPTFTVKAWTVVNNGKQTNVSITGNFDLFEQIKFSGKAEYSHDFKLPKDAIDIPLGETFLFFYNSWGMVFKAAAELSIGMKWDQHFQATFDWSFNSKSKKLQAPKTSFKCVSADFDPEGSLRGSIQFGPFTEIGIKFVCTELARAALRAEGVLEFAGDFVLNNKTVHEASGETKLYEALKASKIEMNAAYNTSVQLSFLDAEQPIDLPWNNNYNLFTWHLVPEFQNTALEQRYGSPASAIGSVSMTKRSLIMPVEVGLKLFDKDGIPVSDWKSPNKYNGGTRHIEHQFDGLDAEDLYTVRPTVKLLFWDMLANPEAPIERNPFPVRIVSFEQTSSHYSKLQGYEYEGKNYFYKFNATTTVELNPEAQHVKDWGYVYHDIYGVDKKISCANQGSNPYADMRYAYYYNKSERTVELSPYVQYDDGNDIMVGKKMTFEVEYDLPVQIISFEQTGSAYSEAQDFFYEGIGYFYKFNATTSVELDNEEMNVRDWGYVYHDIYGVDKKISCANLGSNPYDDRRYAYYSNDSKRSVELSPYIQYIGEEDIQLGKKRTFPLVYSEQTQMEFVDLGLPSGTKWATCNVGANSPEEFGGYYAWGELTEQINYDSYKYRHHYIYPDPLYDYYKNLYKEVYGKEWNHSGGITVWEDIGANISGTEYDIATKYGGRMPTVEECNELVKNCKEDFIQINDVWVARLTGPNGNCILMPLAGYKDEYGRICSDGSNGSYTGAYWTSSIRLNDSGERIGFNDDYWAMALVVYQGFGTADWARFWGLPIRPVR